MGLPTRLDYTKEECEKDMRGFARRYLSHYLHKNDSGFHKWTYKKLTTVMNGSKKDGIKLCVLAPRGNAKSTLINLVFPLWTICYEKKHHIVLVSARLEQAKRFLADIKRELLHNDLIQEDFGIGQGKIWTTTECETDTGIKLVVLGTGSEIRGLKYGQWRPDLILGDEIETSDEVMSIAKRTKLQNVWFDKDYLYAGQAGTGKEGTKTDYIILGTVIGRASLLEALSTDIKYSDWEVKKFQAVEKFSTSVLWKEWTDIFLNRFDKDRTKNADQFYYDNKKAMLAGTKVLWPSGDPYYGLMKLRATNKSAFLVEKQNTGIDLTKVLIKQDELRVMDFEKDQSAIDAIERAMAARQIFGGLDPSVGKPGKAGDPSAISVLARDPQTKAIFVLEMQLRRIPYEAQIRNVLRLHEKYNFKLFGVETVGSQWMVKDRLQTTAHEWKKEGRFSTPLRIKSYDTKIDKITRIEDMIYELKTGSIIFDENRMNHDQQYFESIEQILCFTREMQGQDDAPDALEIAWKTVTMKVFRLTTSGPDR